MHISSLETYSIQQYSNAFYSSSGFSNKLDKQLFHEAKVPSLKEFQKHVSLISGEMYIIEGLVYERSTGNLIGYWTLVTLKITTSRESILKRMKGQLKTYSLKQ